MPPTQTPPAAASAALRALDETMDDTQAAEIIAAELGIAVCSAFARLRRKRESQHLQRRMEHVQEHDREGMSRADLRAAIYEATGILYGLSSLATAQAQLRRKRHGAA